MLLTSSLCDAPHINEFELGLSADAVGLRLTILQVYLYQYWTEAEPHKKGRPAPLPCTVYMCRPNYSLFRCRLSALESEWNENNLTFSDLQSRVFSLVNPEQVYSP